MKANHRTNNSKIETTTAKNRMLPWLGLALIVLLLDQLSKIVIVKLFSHGQQMPVTDFFNLVLAYNRGAAFSFLANQSGWQRYFFTAISIIASIVIIFLLRRHAQAKLFCTALSLILGGALGNLIDRVRYGYVIDFLDFYWKNTHWPAFNVADSAITLGAILFIVDEIKRVEK